MHACENAGVKTHIGAKRDWVVKKSPFFCFFFCGDDNHYHDLCDMFIEV